MPTVSDEPISTVLKRSSVSFKPQDPSSQTTAILFKLFTKYQMISFPPKLDVIK